MEWWRASFGGDLARGRGAVTRRIAGGCETSEGDDRTSHNQLSGETPTAVVTQSFDDRVCRSDAFHEICRKQSPDYDEQYTQVGSKAAGGSRRGF